MDGIVGLGVVGNFVGHLKQAGEEQYFDGSDTVPKGLFPFYVPGKRGFLGVNPFSFDSIMLPLTGENVQAEPEVCIVCDVVYGDKKEVVELIPRQFGAYNDCSLRIDAPKISMKKNWGPCTKGVSRQLIDIDSFSSGGVMDSYRLACYLVRGGDVQEYGVDSPITGYSYFYEDLLLWMVDTLHHQKNSGPFDRIDLHGSDQVLISLGATRYTEFGEKTFLEEGDEVVVVVYDSQMYGPERMRQFALKNDFPCESLCVLKQKVMVRK